MDEDAGYEDDASAVEADDEYVDDEDDGDEDDEDDEDSDRLRN